MVHTVLSAETLAGNKVVNAKGDALGKIEDFMLDVESGRVRYAVLSFGGILGIGNKLFAVPPDALKLDRSNERFVLNVEKEALEAAPGFEKDDWPDFADPELGRSIYSYYGHRPYWS